MKLAARVAGWGLPEQAVAVPVRTLEDEWPRALSQFGQQKLTGIAVAAAEAGWLDLQDDQYAGLEEAHRRAMLQALAIERRLLEVARVFEESQIRFAVLKGPALAHSFYPSPSWRPYGDLDVLVAPEDWLRTCTILTEQEFYRELPEPAEGFDERFGKAAVYRGGGIEIDVHRRIVVGPHGFWIRPEELFEGTTPMSIGGRSILRLDDTNAFLNACVHASLGWSPPLLLPLRDVAQIAFSKAIDWQTVNDRIRRWRLRAVVKHALDEVRETLGVTLPSRTEQFVTVKPLRSERRTLHAYTTTRSRGGVSLSSLRAISGPGNKAAYIRALLFPSREFMEARSGRAGVDSYFRRWRLALGWFRRGAEERR